LVGQVQKLLAQGLFKEVHPAVTYVVTRLPDEKALLAVDAIAAVPESVTEQVVLASSKKLFGQAGTAHVSLLPRGRVVYISGMAERSEELGAATTGTIQQLHGVLKLLGLGAEHVVHIKVFMKPMDDVAESLAAIQAVYAGRACPPISFVEWTNGLPAEIEMVAYLPGDAEEGATVAHRWQPDEKQSPVYCRFAVVDSPTRIYVSGLRSRTVTGPERQVRDIFSQLEATLAEAGSDLRHMAKATYYVADDEVSKALNAVRPEIYDSKRPPAASKASIAGTGDAERGIVVDMIAVPKE
jgi:enamine deaminase RidA (YjgF/YER057c/UK114 family)